MFKKNLKRMLAMVMSASCLLATVSALTVSANELNEDTNEIVFTLNEEDNGQPPVWYDDNGIMLYGANPPSSSSVVDMAYNKRVTSNISSFKHLVYTNVMYTGTTSYVVSVSGDNLKNYLRGKSGREVCLDVYDSSGHHYGGTSASYSPSATDTIIFYIYPADYYTKYYVAVSKTQDNIYINDLNIIVTNAIS